MEHNKKEPVVENKNSLPYPTSTLAPPVTLVDRAKEIEKANESIQSHLNAKLEIIVKQIRALQNEAEEVLKKAKTDSDLHHVSCSFEKKPGTTLHLYEKNSGERYFSRLSPAEWNPPPHNWVGSYKINHELGFDPLDQ